MEAGRVPPHSPFNKAILSCKVRDISIPFVPCEMLGVIITKVPCGNHKTGKSSYSPVVLVKPINISTFLLIDNNVYININQSKIIFI